MLKAIVRRLIAVDRYQQLDAELAANYFLGRTTPDGKRIARFFDMFQRRTGRVLHKKKLEQILTILVNLGFICRQTWQNRPVGSNRRFGKAGYLWGPEPLELIPPLDSPTPLNPH